MLAAGIIFLVVGVLWAAFKGHMVWDVAHDIYNGGGAPTLDFPIICPIPLAVGGSMVLTAQGSLPFRGFGYLAYVALAVFFGFLLWLFDRLGRPERQRQLEAIMQRKKLKQSAKWRGISADYEQAALSDPATLLQLPDDRNLFYKIRDWICAAKCEPMEPYQSYRGRLSEGERQVILAWGFVAETLNGGLHQFLSNSTGDFAEETCAALRQMDATLAAESLDATRPVLFNGQPIPSDRKLRHEMLSAWDQQHGENAASDFLDRYDGQLGRCESVHQAVARCIRHHPEMFTDA